MKMYALKLLNKRTKAVFASVCYSEDKVFLEEISNYIDNYLDGYVSIVEEYSEKSKNRKVIIPIQREHYPELTIALALSTLDSKHIKTTYKIASISNDISTSYFCSKEFILAPLRKLKDIKESKLLDELLNYFNIYLEMNLPDRNFNKVMTSHLVKLVEEYKIA